MVTMLIWPPRNTKIKQASAEFKLQSTVHNNSVHQIKYKNNGGKMNDLVPSSSIQHYESEK